MANSTARRKKIPTEIPQMGTAGFNILKIVQKTRLPPLTANHRHFFGMGSRQKPTVLMVFLPSGF